MKKIILTTATLLTLGFGQITINQSFENFSLEDQFDKVHNVTPETKNMIMVFSKQAGHTVKDFLDTKEPDFLSKKNTLFVADVSAMPTIIQWFVLPTLTSHKYPMMLLNDDELSKKYIDEKNKEKVMLLTFKNKIVVEKKFFDNMDDILKELD